MKNGRFTSKMENGSPTQIHPLKPSCSCWLSMVWCCWSLRKVPRSLQSLFVVTSRQVSTLVCLEDKQKNTCKAVTLWKAWLLLARLVTSEWATAYILKADTLCTVVFSNTHKLKARQSSAEQHCSPDAAGVNSLPRKGKKKNQGKCHEG